MVRSTLKAAFYRSLPVMVGYLIIGFGFGIVLRSAGFGLVWALAMSIFIYAGSMQYVGISLMTAPVSLLTAALTTFMVNARHLFYSISMISKYRNTGFFKPYLIFSLTDETYALLSVETENRADFKEFCFFVSLFNHLYWILGTALGSIFAAALPFPTEGISFSMTALFVCAYVEQWISGKYQVSAALGLFITLFCRLLFGRDLFLIPAMVLITAALILNRKFLSKEDSSHA